MGGHVAGTAGFCVAVPAFYSWSMSEGIDKVNAAVNDFDAVSKTFASGGKVNLHEMMIKGENASMSLKLMVTLRNKVIDAYQEVMRMQV